MLKIGDKVRNKHSNSEGIVVYSTSGASIIGFMYDDEDNLVHFQTLGRPLHTYESDWKRVYKFKYNMKRYLDEKDGVD